MSGTCDATTERNHCATHHELIIRFALWAAGLREVPSWERIKAHFKVSRATAYRWRRSYCDATGINPLPAQSRRALTDAEVRRIKKVSAGLVFARSPDEACRSCEFFKQPSHSSSWWGSCRKHAFPVRLGHRCTQHTSRE